MLDRPTVLQELQKSATDLFIDLSDELLVAQKAWNALILNPELPLKIKTNAHSYLVPSWIGNLAHVQSHSTGLSDYVVLSVDGSQIYPDRHQGTSCSLINIGSVVLGYNSARALHFNTKPFIHLVTDEITDNSVEYINCRRQELEFNQGVALAKQFYKKDQHMLFLFDGSLIFWHLEGKEQLIKENYIAKYIASLHVFYELQIPIVGYISLPKNKELINIVRLFLSATNKNNAINHLVDTDIAHLFLPIYSRTVLFGHNSPIAAYYPPHLKPYFFYLNVGTEIIRIELPAWLATDINRLDQLVSIIIDQVQKGRGYPICLAEAHEQAVVKGADREFFYHMIQKIGTRHNYRLQMSQKSLKKRGIGI